MAKIASRILLVCLLLLYVAPPPGWSQNSPERPPDSPNLPEDVAERIINPLSDLWLLSMQSEFQWYDGQITDKKRLVNITLVQPVLPMTLSENWRMIVRPVIPFASFPFSGFDYKERLNASGENQ